jgi:hypothetical protein
MVTDFSSWPGFKVGVFDVNLGEVSRVAALAMKRGKSVDFTGYWQRHVA